MNWNMEFNIESSWGVVRELVELLDRMKSIMRRLSLSLRRLRENLNLKGPGERVLLLIKRDRVDLIVMNQKMLMLF